MSSSRKQSSSKRVSAAEPLPPRRGFSTIEVLLAVGILAATVSISVPLYQTVQSDAEVTTAAEHIVQALRDAKTYAQAGKADTSWGVYVPEATIFAGEAYVLRNPTSDQEFFLPPAIDTQGLDEVIFSRIDGIPSTTGIIRVTSRNSNKYRDIVVDSNGFIALGSLLSFTGDEESILNSSDNNGTDGDTAGDDAGTTGGNNSSQSASTGGATSSTNSVSGGSTSSSAGSTGGQTGTTGGGTSSSIGSSLSSTSDVSGSLSSSSTAGGGTGNGNNDDDVPSCDTPFTINGGTLNTVGTSDVRVKVLGSQITYGANGPPISVRVSTTLPAIAARNSGTPSWTELFLGSAVDGGEEQLIRNVPSDSPVVLRFNGRYSSLFNRTYQSDSTDGHVVMLRNGDRPRDYAPFGNQQSLASFLGDVIGPSGRVTIGPRDVLFIAELGSLDSVADFQDAVVLVTFIEKPFTCVSGKVPRIKLRFERVENVGDGDARSVTYVGPQAVPFANNQWIPLVDAENRVIVDGGMIKDVPGIAFERGNGWVKILSYGSNRNGKEIVDINALFVHAVITSMENATGVDATENPTDGIVNDTPLGDEFVPGPNEKSMTYKTRVTRENDAIILHWREGNPGSAQQQSSSSASSVSSSAPATTETEVTPDACVARFIVADGVVITQEKSDVTLRILGSAATYGENGPAVSVRARISFDGGVSWQALFRSRALRGGEIAVFRNVPAESRIVLEYEGRYSWLMREVARSSNLDGHFVSLKAGQTFPDVPKIRRRTGLRTFLRQLINDNNTLRASASDVIFLTELSPIDAKAEYQDAVTQLSIEKSSCASSQGTASSSVSSSSTSSSSSSSLSSSLSSSAPNPAMRDKDGDGVNDGDDLCANSAIPESVPREYLDFDRFALTDSTRIGALAIFRYGPTKRIGQYTIEDTRGCTCSQILDVIDNKHTYRFSEFPSLQRMLQGLFSFYVSNSRKFGCGSAIMRMMAESRDD